MVNSKKEVTNMKKLISLTLVLALAAAFTAGCKKKEEAPATPAAPAVEAPKAPEQKPMSSAAAAPAAATPAAPEAEKKH